MCGREGEKGCLKYGVPRVKNLGSSEAKTKWLLLNNLGSLFLQYNIYLGSKKFNICCITVD